MRACWEICASKSWYWWYHSFIGSFHQNSSILFLICLFYNGGFVSSVFCLAFFSYWILGLVCSGCFFRNQFFHLSWFKLICTTNSWRKWWNCFTRNRSPLQRFSWVREEFNFADVCVCVSIGARVGLRGWFKAPISSDARVRIPADASFFLTFSSLPSFFWFHFTDIIGTFCTSHGLFKSLHYTQNGSG